MKSNEQQHIQLINQHILLLISIWILDGEAISNTYLLYFYQSTPLCFHFLLSLEPPTNNWKRFVNNVKVNNFDNYVKAICYVPVAIVTNYRLLKMYEFKIRHINISVHPSLYTEWILNLKLLNWRTSIFLKCVSSYLKTD